MADIARHGSDTGQFCGGWSLLLLGCGGRPWVSGVLGVTGAVGLGPYHCPPRRRPCLLLDLAAVSWIA